MIGHFERKVWPHVNLGLNALRRLVYASSVKGSQRETFLVISLARLASQASLLAQNVSGQSFRSIRPIILTTRMRFWKHFIATRQDYE